MLPLDYGDTAGALRRSLDGVDWDFRNFIPLPAVKRIHSLHWYPAPFPAALVGTLLDILAPTPGRFLDPFCGTAVAPVEAWLRGFQSTGIDVNRFAVDVANAKTSILLSGDRATASSLTASYDRYREKELVSWEDATAPIICRKAEIQEEAQRWFTPGVLGEIALAKRWVSEDAPTEWRAVLRTILSSTLHRASELRDVHYTYVVDRSKTTTPPTGQVDYPRSLRRKITEVFRDAEIFRAEMSASEMPIRREISPVYYAAPAEVATTRLDPGFDVIITSPPYFGMNDYVRSQYLTWLVDPWDGFEEDLGAELGARRDRWSRDKVRRYVDSMTAVLGELRRVLNRGAPLVLVLGQSQSALAREANPVASIQDVVRDLGFDLVWKTERRVRFRKINNTPYRSEVIWVLRKP